MDIQPYLKLLVEKNASDLFFTADSAVKLKVEGRVTSVGKTLLTPDLVEAAANGIMDNRLRELFQDTWECDFAIALPDESARFRVNVFRQRGKVAMVIRLIPLAIPTVMELGLPEILNELVLTKRGLILMVGATGSGKSTTLAAMINYRNETTPGHILTIEDPVEFYHPNKKSIVNQSDRRCARPPMSFRSARYVTARPWRRRWSSVIPATWRFPPCTPTTRTRPWSASSTCSHRCCTSSCSWTCH
jgi:twitching motility protein PilU